MNYSARTDIGKKREVNQDNYIAFINENNKRGFFAVADGMGGHEYGETASLIATEYFKLVKTELMEKDIKEETIEKFLADQIKNINCAIQEMSYELNVVNGMGTTLSMIYIYNDVGYICNVGDSRVYWIDDSIKQITKDHSLVEEMIDSGAISKSEAIHHPKKNIITRALGTKKDIDVDVFIKPIDKEGYFLLCSDGLSNMIEDDNIQKIVYNAKTAKEAVDILIDTANENGGKDNISVILVKMNNRR